MPQFPAVIALSSLNGSTGFKINGEAVGDNSGIAVSSAGDINGDGFADLIIGASGAGPNGPSSGATYVVFGKASGFGATLSLSSLNGSNGFQINGVATGDVSGFSVSSAGDVNHDGFADLIIGAPKAAPNGTDSGASYVVFGKASGFSANLELSSLNGSTGFRISGEAAGDASGLWVSSAGDVNGDGFADLVIGAPGADPNGLSSGATYVVFGKSSGFAANIDLSSLNGANGFQINGEAGYDFSGFSVSSAGDINGDGFGDLIIGAHGAYTNGPKAGASYVVFGKASGFTANLELSSLNGTNGFQINGVAAHDLSGFSVSSAGDVNGDGFSDLIIGAYGANVGGPYAGTSYVVFGKASGFSANFQLSSLNGSNGFRIIGEAPGDYSGFSVSSAGDVNGDGFDDLLIGAPFANVNGPASGSSYVVFGKASGFSATLDLLTLDGTNGFYIDGEAAYDTSGFAVSAAGDVNGDGFADLIVGAPYASPNSALYSGASYVIFGRMPDTSVNRTGTAAAQTLAGGNFNDVLSGLAGNDRLFGHGGNDTLDGGAGIDTAYFSGLRSAYTITRNGAVTVSGSDGTDTLTGIEKATFDDQTVLLGQGSTHTDFNSDLNADLLWQNNNGTPAIWLMNGTAFITGTGVGTNPGSAWHVMSGADFNGDGKSDILWQNNDGTPVIWTMNGTTVLSGGVAGFNPGSAWHVVGSGDFNGDGYGDILWQNTDGTPAVWLMNGTTLISGASLSNPGTSWHVIGAGDFDGDGKSDILWQNDNGTAAVWLMNGTSFVSGSGVGTNPGTSWHVKAAGDFNADGKSDILWQNTDGTAVIWLLNGTSLTSGAQAGFNPGSAWHVVGAGDFNGDGKADIEWQNTDGTPAVWLMNGSSILAGASFANPGSSWHLLAMSS